MTIRDLQPPQPIPYPDNWLFKTFLKTPLLLYRLNLGKLFGRFVLILSTTGRKSKRIHRTPIEYFDKDGRIYIISGFGQQPDWYQNIQADPQVTIQTHQKTLQAVARSPQSEEEWLAVYEYLKHSPVANTLFKHYLNELRQTEVIDEIKRWPALTFDQTDDSCPPPLTADLVWAWPLILLLAALNVLVGWLIQRNR